MRSMHPDPVNSCMAMGFHYENYDLFVTPYKRLTDAMLSCFVMLSILETPGVDRKCYEQTTVFFFTMHDLA